MVPRLILALAIVISCCAQTRAVATISGTVIDAITHLPIQGATVRAGPRGQPVAAARTDSTGRYALLNVPATVVYVSAAREGYLRPRPRSFAMNLAAGDFASHDFTLLPAPSISGTISDSETGQPISECQVFAFRKVLAMGDAWYTPASNATTDARGQFKIRDLDPSDYILEIVDANVGPVADSGFMQYRRARACQGWSFYQNSNLAELATPITVNESGETSLHIRLAARALRSISGTVSVPQGARNQMMVIELHHFDPDGQRRSAAGGTLWPGRFRITNLPEGEYYLTVADSKPQRIGLGPDEPEIDSRNYSEFHYEERIQLGDHDLTGKNILLRPSELVPVNGTVRVEDGTKLPPNVRMMLYSTDGTKSIKSGAFQGHFEAKVAPGEYWPHLQGLPSGYAVTKLLAGGVNLMSQPLFADRTAPSLTFVVSSKLGTLTGTAAGVAVILVPEPIGDRVNKITPVMAFPDEEGEFTLRDLPPGRYRPIVLTEEQHLLERNPLFLRKSATAARAVEIKAGETIHVSLHR